MAEHHLQHFSQVGLMDLGYVISPTQKSRFTIIGYLFVQQNSSLP